METMTSSTLPVDIKIASPCSAKWDDMPGGDTVRSCAHCARKVYNLSEMPAAEAADLVRAAEGKLCVRFYRRSDGTIMTKDCPTGLRAVRVRAARVIGVAFTSLLVWSGFSLSTRPISEYPYLLRLLLDHDGATPQAAPPPPRYIPMMGAINSMTPLPMASPAPAAPGPHIEILMGESGPTATPDANYVQGTVSISRTRRNAVQPTNKSFLRGLEVDNTPREDPFAPELKKGRAAK